ncbi:hypothetical protein R1sor_024632 [Riccia sorocarpa]|uniref:Uncharacterized protein n=1 Tax=Riccia sorocarpa TaxID=122646 RepID=A0ABD3GSX9_9MARC
MGDKYSTVNIDFLLKEEGASGQLVLGYSNRAETFLQLRMYADALEDTEKALNINPRHLKSLVRKAKALFGLKLYKETVTICKEFLRQDDLPGGYREAVSDLLPEATRKDEQTRLGRFEITNFGYGHGRSGDIPSELGDFVGPVELKRTPGMDRGLFPTRDLNPGEILFVANPLTCVRHPKLHGPVVSSNSTTPIGLSLKATLGMSLNSTLRRNLVEMVTHARRNLKDFSQVQLLVQLDALAGPYPAGPVSKDTPPLEFFKPMLAMCFGEVATPRNSGTEEAGVCRRLSVQRLEESSRFHSDEERAEMRRESIQTTEAVEELLRTEPKLRDLTALQKDWIRASFIHMYWHLLEPTTALSLNASKEDHLHQLHLVLEAVRIMRSIDPGSQRAVLMLKEAFNQANL